MFTTLRDRFLKTVLVSILLYYFALHLAVPINLTAVDIGRHIVNGQLVLQGQWDVLYKNFYSFTYPDYHFINHHWLFGVMAYLIFRLGDFAGLSLFYIMVLVLTLLLAFDSARRFANFNTALLLTVLAFLLLVSRPEIRPEGISVFCVALDFWLLQNFLARRIKPAVVLGLVPLIQLVWVNTHIFFFLGPVLIALFLWQARLNGAGRELVQALQILLFISIVVNVFNPSGIGGMLTPLNGFKKFGYDLAENQSAWFMMRRFAGDFVYKYYFIVAAVLVLSMALMCYRERSKALPFVLLSAFAALAGFKAVRLFMPFSFLFIPLAAYGFAPLVKHKAVQTAVGIAAVAGLLGLILFRPVRPLIGLMPHVNASAEFFKYAGLKGPVFSNYDIGGYLIYHLHGREKVFVDNRQEAFPRDFFQNVYIPMQEDAAVWKQKLEAYGFNAVYFYRHDLTPWGQDFLVNHISDPQWAPVFVDDYVIIMARRGSVNQPVIDRFELPQSMFRVVHTNA